MLLACDNGVGGNAYEIVANPGGQESGTVPATTDADSYAGNAMTPVIKAANFAASECYILKDNVFHTSPETPQRFPPARQYSAWRKGIGKS